jgi:hypothetical protein
VTAFALAIFDKLTAQYVAMCTALQAVVLAHSWKEDRTEAAKNGDSAGCSK